LCERFKQPVLKTGALKGAESSNFSIHINIVPKQQANLMKYQ